MGRSCTAVRSAMAGSVLSRWRCRVTERAPMRTSHRRRTLEHQVRTQSAQDPVLPAAGLTLAAVDDQDRLPGSVDRRLELSPHGEAAAPAPLDAALPEGREHLCGGQIGGWSQPRHVGRQVFGSVRRRRARQEDAVGVAEQGRRPLLLARQQGDGHSASAEIARLASAREVCSSATRRPIAAYIHHSVWLSLPVRSPWARQSPNRTTDVE